VKNPKAQFPFIITHFEHKAPTPALDKLLSLNEENTEKLSALLRKIGFLESSMEFSINEILKPQRPQTDIETLFKGLTSVMDSLDSLRRAVAESGEQEWKKGVDFFYEKLLKLLSRFDFTQSARIGMPFDSALHEAVGTNTDSKQPLNTITEIIENGWLYKKKVLKFAKVIVAKEI